MSAPTTGRFVWHELHTKDRAKALAFYDALVGWETRDVEVGGEPYSLCLLDGKDIAGITRSKAPAQVPSHWLPYIAVEDVDAYGNEVVQLGGKLRNEATDIPDVGRFVVVADPQDATFVLYEGVKAYPDELQRPPVGSFCWEELLTTDPEAAVEFYMSLFGYGHQTVDMGEHGTYHLLTRGDRQTAGIMKMPPMVPHAHWMTYLATKDVDAATTHAKRLGAQVHVPPTDIPKVGRFSAIDDPTGAAVALFTGAT